MPQVFSPPVRYDVMLQPISYAFRRADVAASQPWSPPGPVASIDTALAGDRLDLSGTGSTLLEQTHEPAPKMIHIIQPLEHEQPELSVNSGLHLNQSVFG